MSYRKCLKTFTSATEGNMLDIDETAIVKEIRKQFTDGNLNMRTIQAVEARLDVLDEEKKNIEAALPDVDQLAATEIEPDQEVVELDTDKAGKEAATSPENNKKIPSQDALELGSYEKGRVDIHGIPVSIENPRGSIRKGKDASGKPWQTELTDHYGYFEGTVGPDGDPVDVFVRSGKTVNKKDPVYVIEQIDPETGKFDEFKVMMGYSLPMLAKHGYLSNYDKTWNGLHKMHEMSMEEFKEWLSGNTKESISKINPKDKDKPDEPHFSKMSLTDKKAKGITEAEAEQAIDEFMEDLNNNPDDLVFLYYPDVASAPKDGFGDRTKGAFYPRAKKVAIFGENLGSIEDAKKTLRHEVLAHYGLNLFKPEHKREILDMIKATRDDKNMSDVWSRVDAAYENQSEDYKAEEAFARVAENKMNRLGKLWNDLVVLVKKALRAIGLIGDKIGRAELNSLVETIADGIRDNKPQQTFPENDDAQFSRRSGHDTKDIGNSFVEQAAYFTKDIGKRGKSLRKGQRDVMLNLMTGRQIVKTYEGLFGDRANPLEEHGILLQGMDSKREGAMHKAEREVIEPWERLDKKTDKKLSEVMLDATYYELHPELAFDNRFNFEKARIRLGKDREQAAKLERLIFSRPGEANVDMTNELNALRESIKTQNNKIKHEREREKIYPELNARYEGMPDAAKAVYQSVKKSYRGQWKEMESQLISRMKRAIKDDETFRIKKGEIELMFRKAIENGPYFPLSRFGDYVVTATDQDGNFVREHAESEYEQDAIMKMMEEEGYLGIQKSKLSDAKNRNFEGAPQVVTEVFNLMDKHGIQDVELQDDIYQMMLRMMPDMSFAKKAIHRRKVAGYTQDMKRAYSSSMLHGWHHIARIEFADQLVASLDKADDMIKRFNHRKPDTPINNNTVNAAQDVVDHLNTRLDRILNPTGAAWTATAGNIGFTWYLGASPAAGIVNLTQTAAVAYPKLAARFGWKKSGDALMGALKDYMASDFKWTSVDSWKSLARNKNISEEERNFIQSMIDNGTIDVTQSHWIAALADVDTRYRSEMSTGRKKAMRYISSMFHNAEVLNREVTLLAAYRMAKEAGMADPAKYAQEVTYETHFDYSSINRSQFMKNDIVKVITMFKNYSQHMIFLLISNSANTYKVAKQAGVKAAWATEYRKTLTGVLGMHALFAGMLGMPLASSIFMILDMMFEDEDRPYDSKAEFQTWAMENLGPVVGKAVTKGVFNAAGIDTHSRLTLDGLLFRPEDRELEGRAKASFYLEQVAGPMFGIVANAFQGMKDMGQGEVQRGLERMSPKFMRDLSKMLRYAAEEGVLTYNDEAIVSDLSLLELGGQAMGFTPARIESKYDLRNVLKNTEKKYKNRRKQLMSAWYLAIKNKDKSKQRELSKEIREFNKANKDRGYVQITKKQLRQSVDSRRRSSRQTKDGIYLDNRYERLREGMDF